MLIRHMRSRKMKKVLLNRIVSKVLLINFSQMLYKILIKKILKRRKQKLLPKAKKCKRVMICVRYAIWHFSQRMVVKNSLP